MDKKLLTHTFCFNEQDNGGESLIIKTDYYDNGDDINNIYTTQTLTLQSYFNSASFELCGIKLTPELLRKLANELEIARNKLVK